MLLRRAIVLVLAATAALVPNAFGASQRGARPGTATAAPTTPAPVPAPPQTRRVRGTITALEGNVLAVRSRDGRNLKIELTDRATISIAQATTLAELAPGSFLGVTARKRANGAFVALEVHTLPPTAQQGIQPWDVEPGAQMISARLGAVAQQSDGQLLTLDFMAKDHVEVEYIDSSQKVLVPAGTPIIVTPTADRSALAPGEDVFLTATVAAGGRLTTSGRVLVSKDGIKPPQ